MACLCSRRGYTWMTHPSIFISTFTLLMWMGINDTRMRQMLIDMDDIFIQICIHIHIEDVDGYK